MVRRISPGGKSRRITPIYFHFTRIAYVLIIIVSIQRKLLINEALLMD